MKSLKKIFNWFMFLLTSKGQIANDAVNDGLVSYGGQGRNEFGG